MSLEDYVVFLDEDNWFEKTILLTEMIDLDSEKIWCYLEIYTGLSGAKGNPVLLE